VGGTDTTAAEIPWQVALTRSDPGSGTASVFCGGSLINANWVMTAAHCTVSRAANSMYATVGMTKQSSTAGRTTSRVFSKVEHPSYNSGTQAYDFSILRVQDGFDLTSSAMTNVRAVCWPSASPVDSSDVIISGWGTQSSGGSQPNTLKKATVNVIPRATCNTAAGYSGSVIDSMFCAGIWPAGGKDTCQGDSGGPLVDQIGGKYELLGVTSWGVGCAGANKPGVYGDVKHVLSWMASTAGSECPRA
jgi:secreted trypsin-like serine protease